MMQRDLARRKIGRRHRDRALRRSRINASMRAAADVPDGRRARRVRTRAARESAPVAHRRRAGGRRAVRDKDPIVRADRIASPVRGLAATREKKWRPKRTPGTSKACATSSTSSRWTGCAAAGRSAVAHLEQDSATLLILRESSQTPREDNSGTMPPWRSLRNSGRPHPAPRARLMQTLPQNPSGVRREPLLIPTIEVVPVRGSDVRHNAGRR